MSMGHGTKWADPFFLGTILTQLNCGILFYRVLGNWGLKVNAFCS